MQGQDTQKTNVISLFSNRDNAAADAGTSADDASTEEESFDDVMKRNAKNKERMEKERTTANKSVLRSYRIKH